MMRYYGIARANMNYEILTRYSLATLFLLIAIVGFSQAQNATKPENLGQAVNSEYNEIAPVISPDGQTLYFSRISHPQNSFGDKGSQDIWFAEAVNGSQWGLARRLPAPLNKEEYNSLYSITPDGNTILIKGAYRNGRYETRGFSTSQRLARGWSAPEKLDIPGYEKISKGQFDCGVLSNDGKVLVLSFSEKKNSKEDDIYVCFKQKNDSWTRPQNLGSEINTDDFTETTPFLAADGYTIYFSSNRPGGQGSNDIYYSKRIDKSWKRWSKPVNLGPAVNTDGYDAYYTVSALGDFAYLTSFKETLGKGDVVRIPLGGSGGEGDGKDTTNVTQPMAPAPDPVVILSGIVIDAKTGKPVEAKIIYEDMADGEEAGTATTNPLTGEYKIVLPYGKKYSMRAVAPNFIAEGENVDLTDSATAVQGKGFREIANKSLKLVPIEAGQVVRLNNISFEFAKATLRSESFPELDRIALTMTESPKLTIELGGHTDDVGGDAANLKLSQDRADTVREYLIGKGIEPDRIASKGYGEARPVATNDTPEGQAANRRVEFTILTK